MTLFAERNSSCKLSVVLDGVQYLRGLCAVIVVISHCNGIIGKPEHYSRMAVADWSIASLFAVAAFFSISGFIIVIASLDDAGRPRSGRAEFARRRFVRIVPFLWLCTIGYNLLSWGGTGQMDWASAARTLVLWPTGELKPNVAWSLRHELLFYALFATAILGARRRPALLLGWVAASALFYLLSYDLGLAADVLGEPWFETLKVLMGGDHGANFQFAVGVGLAYFYLMHSGKLRLGTVPPATILIVTGLACVVVSHGPLAFGLPVALLWSALAVPVLAAAIAARPAQGWAGRIGLVLGNASFAIYLVHNPVLLVLLAIARAAQLSLASQTQLLAFLGFSVLTTVVAGVIVHHLVEAPLIRACDRWTRKPSGSASRLVAD